MYLVNKWLKSFCGRPYISTTHVKGEDSTKIRQTYESKIKKLEDERIKLVRLAARGTLDEDGVKLALDENEKEKGTLKVALPDLVNPKYDFIKCLEHTVSAISDCRTTWKDAKIGGKQRFQQLIFPKGIEVDFPSVEPFSTARVFSNLSGKQQTKKRHIASKKVLVAVGGIEPPTSAL